MKMDFRNWLFRYEEEEIGERLGVRLYIYI